MTDVPKPSLAERVRRWVNDTPRGLLGTFADLIQVVTVLFLVGSLIVTQGVVPAIMASCLAVITLTSLLIIWRLEVALRRQSAGAATPKLAAAIGNMTRAHQALSSRPDDATPFIESCEAACKDFGTALTTMTGRTCRVTLQQVYVPEDKPDTEWSVQVIATSYGPQPGNRADAVDLIRDNTDFQTIMEGHPIYLCNDLAKAIPAGYRNSHWTPEKLAEWHLNGAYPYRSTAVWPVRESVMRDGQQTWKLIGFVSADTRESGTFDRDRVRPLGEAFAHSAYVGISTYQDLKREGLWDQSNGSTKQPPPRRQAELPTTGKSS